jgi:alpha-D-ribose 1-methylphosphonate 5-triphosphate synthase subunit PhnH
MKLITSGFTHPIHEAQTIFRQVLDAISSPGSLHTFGADFTFGLANSATTQLLLALTDNSTPVWLSPALRHDEILTQNVKFHTNAPLAESTDTACFAVMAENETVDLTAFSWGSAEYPETNTTLAIQINGFDRGETLSLSGPGIDGQRTVFVDGIDNELLKQITQIQRSQPLGIDVLLTSGNQLMALPRTTHIELSNREALTCTLQ